MEGAQFKWTHVGAGLTGPLELYQLGSTGVARLISRLGGTWFVRLDYHLPDSTLQRECSSYEAGVRGVELWAARHEARLRAEVEAQHQAWFAKQHWRVDP